MVCAVTEHAGLPTVYSRPRGNGLALKIPPPLASWNAGGDRAQLRLKEFGEHAAQMALPLMEQLNDPLALRLDVGLPPNKVLLNQRDLDNYADPLARHLSQASGRQFTSVWCTKHHAETSFLHVSTAIRCHARDIQRQHWLIVRTTASWEKDAAKRQIYSQLEENGVVQLDEGPVSLHLAFTVGHSRNWINLWKPTIDSLDLILGRTHPAELWNPRDGRITELGLHCEVDGDLGNDVLIAVAARQISGT
jgi:hypothetical protein